MLDIKKVMNMVPPKIRARLRNRFTYLLYSYLVLRPDTKKLSLKNISIEVTDRCNLSCSYCIRSKGVVANTGDMEFEMFKDIVDQASQIPSVNSILIGGYGEPLLYPHLIEGIKYIKTKRNGGIYTGFTTNGTLLNERWADNLIASGVDHVAISLNSSSRDKYLQANGFDLYDDLVKKIMYFLDAANNSDSKIRIIVQFLDFRDLDAVRKNDAMEFKEFWEPRLGRNGDIVCKTFVGWLSMLQWAGRNHKMQMSKAKKYPCYPLATSSFNVAKNGNVLPCCGAVLPFPDCSLNLGNVRDKHLSELCLTGKILELRKMNLTGDIYNIDPCNRCEEYMALPFSPWIRNVFHPFIGPKWF